MSKMLDFYDLVNTGQWFTHSDICNCFNISYRTASRWIAMIDARIELIRETLNDSSVRMRKNGN